MAASRKPEHITVMRSQLGRVRGLGAAKAGTEHWIAERIMALFLVPLTIWFVVSAIGLLGADQPRVAAWVAHPWNAALLIALLIAGFHHLQLGMQVVYEDYIDSTWLQNTCSVATKFAALLLALAGSVSVLKLALGAH